MSPESKSTIERAVLLGRLTAALQQKSGKNRGQIRVGSPWRSFYNPAARLEQRCGDCSPLC